MPRVQAPEEQLDEPARDLRREHSLGGRVEAADVQRARVAQRGGGRAGRERLVHVHDVERGALEQRVDRVARVERQRHACRRAAPASAIVCIGASTAHLTGREQRRRAAAAAARISRRDSRTCAREPLAAITSTLCPRCASPSDSDSTYSLTSRRAPHGIGRHLRDRKGPVRPRAVERGHAGMLWGGAAVQRRAHCGLRCGPQLRLRLPALALDLGLLALLADRGDLAARCSAMNSSVRSCATGSGTCFGGDFIR